MSPASCILTTLKRVQITIKFFVIPCLRKDTSVNLFPTNLKNCNTHFVHLLVRKLMQIWFVLCHCESQTTSVENVARCNKIRTVRGCDVFELRLVCHEGIFLRSDHLQSVVLFYRKLNCLQLVPDLSRRTSRFGTLELQHFLDLVLLSNFGILQFKFCWLPKSTKRSIYYPNRLTEKSSMRFVPAFTRGMYSLDIAKSSRVLMGRLVIVTVRKAAKLAV